MSSELEKLLGCVNENPLDNILTDGGYTAVFRSIAVVGDSLSSGELEAETADGNSSYHDFFEYSWGQFLARMCGNRVYNFSRGGMTALQYCISFADNNRYWSPEFAAQGYIIALGVNDIINANQELGCPDDIDMDDYKNNKNNFAGYYAQIIQRYKMIQPRAKFFLMTMPNDPRHTEKIEAHRKLLYALSEKFDNTYVLDIYKYGPKYDDGFRDIFFMRGHMNPMGYMLTARITASYIDYIIRHNPADFKEVGFIGTDLYGKKS